MTITRWITLLTLSMLISGCGVLEDYFFTENTTQPPPPPPMPVESEPPQLHLMVGHVAMPMDQGSYCWVTGEQGLCVDMIPPVYTEDMHLLVIGNTLELLFDAPFPDTVNVALHPGSNLMTRIADIQAIAEMNENGRVLVTMPERLSGDFVLTVFAIWEDGETPSGDAFYSTPIRLGG